MIIKKLDGSTEEFEVVASFELADFAKTYVTYTKEDIDMNGNVITYTNTIVDSNLEPVETDEEWAKIKETLLKMTKGDSPEGIKEVSGELVETDKTKQDERHALSISKDFQKAIMDQYSTGNEPVVEEEPIVPGEDIEVPEFNPVPEPEPVVEAPTPEPVPEVEEVEPTPVVEEEPEVEMPEPEPVVEVEMPIVEEEPVVEESAYNEVAEKLDKIIAELQELRDSL